MNVSHPTGAAFLSLLCGIALGGCSASGEPSVGDSLREVRKSHSFTLYYAGGSVEGNALEHISPEDWAPDVGATFVYGSCEPPSGLFAEGGCQPPLQIQNESICARRPAMFNPPHEVFDFRGAKAHWTRGTGFEVFTGRTTVVIFGTRGSHVKAAARGLRDVNSERPPAKLPPPAPGTLYGERACQGT